MLSEILQKYLVFEEPTAKSFCFLEFTTRARFGGQCLGLGLAPNFPGEYEEWWIIDAGVVNADEIDEEELPEEERKGLNNPQLEAIRTIWHLVKGVIVGHAHDDHIAELPKLFGAMADLNCDVPIVTAPFTAYRIIKKFITHNEFVEKNNQKENTKKMKKVELPRIIQDIFVEKDEEQDNTEEKKEVRKVQKSKPVVLIKKSDKVLILAAEVPHSTPHSYVLYFEVKTNDAMYNFFLLTDSSLQDSEFTPGLTWNYLTFLNDHSPVTAAAYDSLYAGRNGYTRKESVTRAAFRFCLENSPGNLVETHFATNVYRTRMVMEEAQLADRWHWLVGRTMEDTAVIGENLGMLPEKWTPKEWTNPAVISVTGNQAEQFAAATLASFKEKSELVFAPNTSFAHLAEIIPGNEKKVVKMLLRIAFICNEGTVFVSPRTFETIKKIHGELGMPNNIVPVPNLHVSGHMSEGDQKIVLSLCKAQYVLPIHYPNTPEKIEAIKNFLNVNNFNCPIFNNTAA